jgi:hypothetical protein
MVNLEVFFESSFLDYFLTYWCYQTTCNGQAHSMQKPEYFHTTKTIYLTLFITNIISNHKLLLWGVPTTGIFSQYLSLADCSRVVGTEHFDKYWPRVRFPSDCRWMWQNSERFFFYHVQNCHYIPIARWYLTNTKLTCVMDHLPLSSTQVATS